jgi:hypothetical protein
MHLVLLVLLDQKVTLVLLAPPVLLVQSVQKVISVLLAVPLVQLVLLVHKENPV